MYNVSLVYCPVFALPNSWQTGCHEWPNGFRSVLSMCSLVIAFHNSSERCCDEYPDGLHSVWFVYCLVVALEKSWESLAMSDTTTKGPFLTPKKHLARLRFLGMAICVAQQMFGMSYAMQGRGIH